MRRSDKELKEKQQLETVIARAQVCRLGLVDNGLAYIVPLNFGYHDGSLYFHCASEGRKLDLIRSNATVSFEMEADVKLLEGDKPCGWTTRFASIMGYGRAEILEAPEEKRKGLEIVFGHYSSAPCEFVEDTMKRIVVIRVDIDSMTGKASKWDVD